jgi:hypothetical protein
MPASEIPDNYVDSLHHSHFGSGDAPASWNQMVFAQVQVTPSILNQFLINFFKTELIRTSTPTRIALVGPIFKYRWWLLRS